MNTNRIRATACLLALLFLCLALIWAILHTRIQDKFGVLNEGKLIQIPLEELPEDTLYITYDRRRYQRGTMTLIIPAIDVYTPVGESTEATYLKEMPGLYEFSALPGKENGNTSIAGHRDIHDMVFYHLDKVREGDYLYLLHEGTVYRYEYTGTTIIRPDDWSVIKPRGFSGITLTTCDPIGTTTNRLVVQGRLVDSEEFDESYTFARNKQETP